MGQTRSAPFWRHIAAFGIIALLAGIIYSNTFSSPFVFDDLTSIVRNPKIKDLANFFSLNILTEPRPLVDLTFALNYHLGGLNVFGYHLANLGIHILAGFIAYLLALTMFSILDGPRSADGSGTNPQARHWGLALVAALIFVAHPVQTQAVTYVVQRYASMAALFYMSAVLFYILGRRRRISAAQSQEGPAPGPGRRSRTALVLFFLTAVCALLAFLSKQHTVSLPAAILLSELILFDRTWRGWRRKLAWIVPLGLVCLVAGAVLLAWKGQMDFSSMLEDVEARTRDTSRISRWEYLCTQWTVLVEYIRLLVLPVGLNLDHMHPVVSGFWQGTTPIAAASLAGLAGLAAARLAAFPVFAFAVFWFFITLSVESSIFPIRDAMFEHRLYLPMFGFALLAAWMLSILGRHRPTRFGLMALGLIAVLAATAYARNLDWKSEISLWSDVAVKSPHNHRAWYNLGNAYKQKKEYRKAAAAYARAVENKRSYVRAWYNWGNVHYSRKDWAQAIPMYRQALTYDPGYSSAWLNLGLSLVHRRENDKAISALAKVLRLEPNNQKAHYNLGLVHERLSNFEQAASHYRKAIQAGKGSPEAHFNLANVLVQRKSFLEAEKQYKQAIEQRPGYVEAHFNLANLYLQQKRFAQAKGQYQRTLDIKPDFARGHFMLGYAAFQQGRFKRAAEAFRQAGQLKAGFFKAHVYEGYARGRANQLDLAIQAFQQALRHRPEAVGLRLDLGRTYMRAGQYAQAVAQFNQVLRMDPGNRQARGLRNRAQSRLQGTEQ